jgi:hypothetical protein
MAAMSIPTAARASSTRSNGEETGGMDRRGVLDRQGIEKMESIHRGDESEFEAELDRASWGLTWREKSENNRG